MRDATSDAFSFSWSARRRALVLWFLFLLCPAAGRAIVFEDLDLLYAENFDDDLSLAGLVPQADVFRAGPLIERDIGNGPFTPVSLEAAPSVPRGAVRATVTNTHRFGFPFEAKVLSYGPHCPPEGTGSVAVRGSFDELSRSVDANQRFDVGVGTSDFVSGVYATVNFMNGVPVLLAGEQILGTSVAFATGAALPAPVGTAILGGAPFDVTLLVDREAGVASGELRIGSTVVTTPPLALSLVDPGDSLPFQGTVLTVTNVEFGIDWTVVRDTVSVDTNALEVRGDSVDTRPDADADTVPDACDACPAGDDLVDSDGDAVADACDVCPLDAENDADGDGACGDVDSCPGADDRLNADGDALPDACDVCPSDAANDADGDGICGNVDNCPVAANSDQADLDEDGLGDACDPDVDGDGAPNGTDTCPFDPNPDQLDSDGDGAGDACDADLDGDGVIDSSDACLPSPVGAVVNAAGCSIGELCPCAHPSGGDRWKNHGAYVSCVAHAANDFVGARLIGGAERDAILSSAGASSCGAKN